MVLNVRSCAISNSHHCGSSKADSQREPLLPSIAAPAFPDEAVADEPLDVSAKFTSTSCAAMGCKTHKATKRGKMKRFISIIRLD